MRSFLFGTTAAAAIVLGAVAGLAQGSGGGSGTGGAANTRTQSAPGATGGSTSGQGSTTGTQGSTGGQQGSTSGSSSNSNANANASANANVNLNTQQTTQVRQSFSSVNIAPATGISFGVSVGTIVPDNIVTYWHDIPGPILQVVPQWRGYKVVLVRDEYVIIEPRTRKIVTVIHKG
jgi:hypothetical protein